MSLFWKPSNLLQRMPPLSQFRAPRSFVITGFVMALSLVLAACLDQKAMLQKLVPKDDDAFARRFIEAVRKGDYATTDKMLDPSLKGPEAKEGLKNLHHLAAQGEPLSVETIGCYFEYVNGQHRTNLSYQIHFPTVWLVGNVYLDPKPGAQTVLGIHFKPIPESLEVLSAFTLHGKSWFHYLVLAVCLVNPLFILSTLVVCARTRLKRKWVWIVFILFGICVLRLDWTTGQFDLRPLYVQVLGASVFRPENWVLGASVPLGAILFLVRRRKLALTDAAPEAPPAASVDVPAELPCNPKAEAPPSLP